jgi:hypothetical protein
MFSVGSIQSASTSAQRAPLAPKRSNRLAMKRFVAAFQERFESGDSASSFRKFINSSLVFNAPACNGAELFNFGGPDFDAVTAVPNRADTSVGPVLEIA